jgi:hypothetical protein
MTKLDKGLWSRDRISNALEAVNFLQLPLDALLAFPSDRTKAGMQGARAFT